jgi:hypothetical protein
MIAVAAVLLIFQHIRYTTTNKIREKKWNSLTDAEKKDYLNNTTDEGSNRLDYRFRI